MLYEYFVCLCLVCASGGREILCFWFYQLLVRDPGVMLCSQHSYFDSKLTTFMAARTHKKLCYVEGGCYINILFVSALFVPVKVAKLCVCGFIQFCCGSPVMLC